MPRATLSAPAYFLACGLLLAFVAPPANAADSIGWMTDYAKAAEIAARERKLLLLHFYTDDCAPCRKLEANVFPQPEVVAAIHAAYVPVKVNVGRTPELARKYQVPSWPTDVFVTHNWLEVNRSVTPQDPAKYVAMLNETAARSGSALVAKASPAQAKPVAHEQRIDHASEFQSPVVENGPQRKPQDASSQLPPKPQAAGARPQSNPYSPGAGDMRAAANAKSAPGARPAPPTSGAWQNDSEYAPANPAPSNPAPSNPPAHAAEPAPAPVARPQVNPHVAPPAPAPGAEKKASALPPVGMDGYCVVTVAEKRVWTKGDKRFGAIHRGRLYLFATAEAQKIFLGDPDRFSPALSGYDPVVFSETGKLVDGKRSHGLAFNNQMHLFASEESLKKFEAAPAPFADTVYQALLKSDNGSKMR